MMKIKDRFKAYRPLALIGVALALTGCDSTGVGDGGESFSGGGCASEFAQANARTGTVEEDFKTFTITKEDSMSNPPGADLDKALFRQFVKAAEPLSEDRALQDFYDFMMSEADKSADFGDLDKLPDFMSVRNGFDLLESMIIAAQDRPQQRQPLQDARDAMASCARDAANALENDQDILQGFEGGIQVPSITVVEDPDSEDGPTDEWRMRVNYEFIPNPVEDSNFAPEVSRVLNTPQGFVVTFYNFDEFRGPGAASGFKQPGELTFAQNAALGSEVGDSIDNGDINQDTDSQAILLFESFRNDDAEDAKGIDRGETDRFTLSIPNENEKGEDNEPKEINLPQRSSGSFEGSFDARCIRATVDYADADNRVLVELGGEPCPGINNPDLGFDDPDVDPPVEFQYRSANPNTSQTRPR